MIKTFLNKYQWIIVFQKVNVQLKFIKKQLNKNPESNINSNNDVDFKMELTKETITKRKHDFNNTSKANNDSNNNKGQNTNKDHVSNTNTSCKKKFENKDNHKDKKSEKSSKERKRKQETKELSMNQNIRVRKGKSSMFIMGDNMVKKLNGYF